MKRFLIVQLFSFLLFGSLVLNAQQFNKYRSLNTSDGLSQNSVYSIVQDHTGFIWIGTKDGLNRYDGYSFKVYRKNPFDSLSISGNWIQSLLIDSENQLWIGTFSSGLNRLSSDRKKFTHFRFPNTKPQDSNNRILTIYQTSDHRIWIGASNGLYFLNKNNLLEQVVLPEKISITSILEAGKHIWLGTWGLGIYKMDRETKSVIHYSTEQKNSIGGNYIRSIIQDNNHKIWLIAYGGGLSEYDSLTNRFINYQSNPTIAVSSDIANPNSFNQHLVWTITEIDSIYFWLGYSDGSILSFNRTTNQFDLVQSTLTNKSAERINQIMPDKSGLIWIAGIDNGIRIYNPRNEQFNHLSVANSAISSNQIISAFIENDRSVWLGSSDNGLFNYNPIENKIIEYRQNNRVSTGVSNNRIESILVDSKKRVWVGTYNGLNLLDTKRKFFEHIPYKPNSSTGLSHPYITSIVEDRDGSIWIATFGGGLNRYNPVTKIIKQIQRLNAPEIINSDFINGLFIDSKNYLWIGSVDAGITRYNYQENSSEFYTNNTQLVTSLSHNNVQTFHEDKQGQIWIGTYGGGLNLLQSDGTFHHFSQENGFFNNSILAMQSDRNNFLWIATNSGLVKFNTSTYQYTIFDDNNGLQGNQFSKASSADKQNEVVLFAGNNGINLFKPQQIVANNYSPPIVLTATQDLIELVKESDIEQISYYLPFNKNYISFEFASLDYTGPSKNLFSHRMQGLNEEWSNPSPERFVNYSNLESGNYIFEFKGSNNEGFWSTINQVNIVVDLPFYSKISFQITVFLILLGFLLWLYRIRLSKFKEIEKTRFLIARDLHDEIGGTLTGIGLLAEAMTHTGDLGKSKTMLKSIKNNVAVAQESISDIIWSITPKNDNWHDLLKRMNDFAGDVLESQPITYSFDTQIDFENELKMETRQHLWRIYKELITNIARHSKCKQAEIKLSNQNGSVFLEISDDGIGFDPEIQHEGNGLNNIKSRASSLNATVSNTSQSAGGCQWQIRFKN